jgi:hypothetical protein
MFSERITMSAIVFIGIFSLFVTGEYDCYSAAVCRPNIDRCLQVRELIELEATLCNAVLATEWPVTKAKQAAVEETECSIHGCL